MSTPYLAKDFDTASDKAAYEKLRQREFDTRQDEMKISNGTITEEQVSRPINSGRISKNATSETARKKKKVDDHFWFLMMLDQLNDQLEAIESALVGKYGEQFAENLAAELLDEEQFKVIMQIEDEAERRRAIADAINNGIANGSIDPKDAYENPDFKEWLDKYSELESVSLKVEASTVNAEAEFSEPTSNVTKSLDQFFS